MNSAFEGRTRDCRSRCSTASPTGCRATMRHRPQRRLPATARAPASSIILDRAQQEFDIALRPGDRAFGRRRHAPALRRDPGRGLVANALVDVRIADDAALADFLAPGLELRLDQRDQPRAGSRERAPPSTFGSAMKLASQTTMSTGSGTMSGGQVRALVCSWTMTRSSCAISTRAGWCRRRPRRPLRGAARSAARR